MTSGPSGGAAFKSNMVLWRILLHGLGNAATRHALSPRLQMRVKTLSCERKAREKSTTCRDAVRFSANRRWSRMSFSSTSPHFRAVCKLSSSVRTLVHYSLLPVYEQGTSGQLGRQTDKICFRKLRFPRASACLVLLQRTMSCIACLRRIS